MQGMHLVHGHALQLIGRSLDGVEQCDGLAVGDRNDEVSAWYDVADQRVGTGGMAAAEEVVNIHDSIMSRGSEPASEFDRNGDAGDGLDLLGQ